MAKSPKILILGGTEEARTLAETLSQRDDCWPVTSLAGRTKAPRMPQGESRRGGFGGADGLASYIRDNGIKLLVVATHPFAAQIARHAAEASLATGVPRLVLLRPPWTAVPGDRWCVVGSASEAARKLPEAGRRVFLAIGRQDLAAFSGRLGVHYLIRSIEKPETLIPNAQATYIQSRGPFVVAEETALMRTHEIDCLVTRNAGGNATYAKVVAARNLGLPVLMIARPAVPEGPQVSTPADALAWITDRIGLHC